MSIEHKCTNCKGLKYNGLAILCKTCMNPWFLECIPTGDDIKELMKLIDLTNTSLQSKQKAYETVRLLFGSNSRFGLKCPNCNDRETQNINNLDEKCNQLTGKINRRDKSINELNEKIKVIETENEILKQNMEKIKCEQNENASTNLTMTFDMMKQVVDALLIKYAIKLKIIFQKIQKMDYMKILKMEMKVSP